MTYFREILVLILFTVYTHKHFVSDTLLFSLCKHVLIQRFTGPSKFSYPWLSPRPLPELDAPPPVHSCMHVYTQRRLVSGLLHSSLNTACLEIVTFKVQKK